MLQEYLRNQEESTKKMERRIDFIHESLGNKSEVLFKQVIKLDEDIKKLREDHDRSLTLVKLDVAAKYQELLNKSMRIEDTSYGNSKHLGSIYNRLQALEGSSLQVQEREESNTQPPSLLLQCHHKKKHNTQVHEDNEEEEREYEEQLNDEDEEQSIDINASPKQSMDTPSPRDPRFSPPRSQASTLPRLEAMQRPSPPTEEEDTWQYDPIDPNKISPMKLKEFNAKEGTISPCPSCSQSTTITTIITTTQVHVFPNKLGATTHSPPSSTTARETPEDIKELFEKAKVQPTFKTLYKIEDPGQFSIPCQVNGHYFDRTLCDSGSCINLMPTQTAKLLGITRLQPAQISIGLANHTIAKPRGVVVDVLLEIGDIKIPVDFHVMNIQGGCDTPLILGRPFLATAGAVMDLPNRRMSLANVDKTVFYKTIPFISPNKLSYLITAQGRPREATRPHSRSQ
ncbi:unnamed protein product [Microthlaspi erraticum]|uniref:Aspartic peptidase DDI1-type domain-containing protein n=1 Tax=Microthlaspi erraticum TaxID=1685480 RepID=A0A6D2KIT5_9BRAS|nr:unnamed protein product [Microthlaspi erraticum]